MTTFTHTHTPLLSQQVIALERAAGREAYALFMEQGTGKTLVFLEEAMRLYARGHIDCICVLAPNGVHENWVLTEALLHIPDTVPFQSAYWSAAANRKERAALDAIMTPRAAGAPAPLRMLTCNFEALLTDRCFKFVEAFVRSGKCYIVADESHKIKDMGSRRTKRSINLSKQAVVRRIGTGTNVANSPVDVFAQFEFLDPHGQHNMLGTHSLVAFRKEYCDLLPPQHGVIRHILERKERALGRKLTEHEKEVMMPAIVRQDEMGRPIYKNLDQLQALLAAHSYRVLKTDCLDLPPQEYTTRYFHLTAAQRRVYDQMENEYRYVLDDNTALYTTRLVALSKLQQITSGFLLMKDGSSLYLEDNPRIELLRSELEDFDRPAIIWSQFKEEQRNIERMLKGMGRGVETVNGDTPMGRRQSIRAEFMAGNLQYINAHPETLGTGFTLTRANLNIYYSNGFKLIDRVQSEARTHRIGAAGESVEYRDFVAIDTRDDDVVWALQHKLDTAAIINGDPERKLWSTRA